MVGGIISHVHCRKNVPPGLQIRPFTDHIYLIGHEGVEASGLIVDISVDCHSIGREDISLTWKFNWLRMVSLSHTAP